MDNSVLVLANENGVQKSDARGGGLGYALDVSGMVGGSPPEGGLTSESANGLLAETRRRSLPRPRLRPVLVVVSLAFVAVAVKHGLPEIRESAMVLRELHSGWLMVALLLQAAAIACLPYVYSTSVAAVGSRLRYADALQVSMGAFTLSRVLPAGGAAGAVFAARRLRSFGVPGATAALAVAIGGVLTMVALGLVVLVIEAGAGLRGTVPFAYVALSAVGMGLFVGAYLGGRLVLVSAGFRARLYAIAARVAGRRADVGAWRSALDDLSSTVPSGRSLRPVLLWASASWLLQIGALWTMFLGLGHVLPLGVLMLGFAVANLITALPHTPGGVGLVEVGMAGTYIAFAVPAPVAIAAVLAYRLIAYWLPVAAGVPQFLRGSRSAQGVALP